MTDSQNPESELADAPAEQTPATADDELAEGEEILVDALTGEVTTLTAQEAAAEEVAEQPATAVAVQDIPDGISPELFNDPYGEEILSTSKEEFEQLLEQFSGGFQAFKEGEIVNATVLRVTEAAVILEFFSFLFIET